jgi:hypothetical protein
MAISAHACVVGIGNHFKLAAYLCQSDFQHSPIRYAPQTVIWLDGGKEFPIKHRALALHPYAQAVAAAGAHRDSCGEGHGGKRGRVGLGWQLALPQRALAEVAPHFTTLS